MSRGVHLLSGLADEDAKKLGLETELSRFANALDVEPDSIQVHDMLAITSGRAAMPAFGRHDLAIIGGSPECILKSTEQAIANERELVRRLIASANKVLAICYGFQLLVRALDGKIGKANPPERGFREVEFTGRNQALNNIPRNAFVSTFHSDAVHELPNGLESITVDDGSGIQMAIGKINGAAVCGTQFHPEILTRRPDLLMAQVPEDVSAVVRTEIDRCIAGPEILKNFKG